MAEVLGSRRPVWGAVMTSLPEIEVRVVAHAESSEPFKGGVGLTVTLQYLDRLGYPETFQVWCAQDEAPAIGRRHTLKAVGA